MRRRPLDRPLTGDYGVHAVAGMIRPIRLVRRAVLALLTLWFGPQIMELAGALFKRHLVLVVGVIVVAAGVGLLLWLRRKPDAAESPQ